MGDACGRQARAEELVAAAVRADPTLGHSQATDCIGRQAFSVAGVNGIVGDYYYLAASNKWWNSLKPEHQAIIEKIIVEEVLPLGKQANYCNDKQLIDKYGTTDPTAPGIFVMNPDQASALANQLGDATQQWIKANTPDGANEWVDKFVAEAKAAVAANPLGQSDLEATDCGPMNELFAKYRKK